MQRLSKPAVLAILLAILAGCASGQNAEPQVITETRAGGIMSTGLGKLEEYYYKNTKASDLVEAGLAKAEEDHPAVHFTMRDGETTAYVEDRVLYRFPNGSDAGESHYWGRNIAAAFSQVAGTAPAVSLESLLDSFMEGVVGHLHERTSYSAVNRTPEDWSSRRKGDGGLGLGLERHRSGWLVKDIYDIGLRRAAAVKTGDIIIEIDGYPVETSSLKPVLDRLSGPVGSTVTLSVVRQQSPEPISISLERARRGSNTVAVDNVGRFTKIEVSQFSASTAQDLGTALSHWASEERGRAGLILDLRDNDGGLLETAIETAKLFLDHAKIAEVHGRHPNSNQEFQDPTIDRSAGAPLVVLVNADTASGAEILTAALQDAGRAIVIGEPTYGAGTVQIPELFSSQARGLIPWGEVITPSGYRLDRRGVMPTVCTSGAATAETVLVELSQGGRYIDHATRTRDIDPDDAAAVAAFRALCPPRSDQDDRDLELAEAILADPALYDQILAAGGK